MDYSRFFRLSLILHLITIPLRPALFLSDLTEDQTSAASDRDPLGNPEIRN